jgi:mannose-6-phosphate isomerase-like protein (cupin superfamily)
MRVITKNEVKEPFRAPLGEVVYELIGTSTETGSAKLHSLAHVIIPPGKLSPAHYHKISEETYCMLKGQARVVIDGQEFTLSPGQSLLILPGEVHQIFNGHREDVEFLVVCAPPWTPNDFFVVDELS